jgi:hypothetical protein
MPPLTIERGLRHGAKRQRESLVTGDRRPIRVADDVLLGITDGVTVLETVAKPAHLP